MKISNQKKNERRKFMGTLNSKQPESLGGQGRKFTSDTHRREQAEPLNHNSPEEIERRVKGWTNQ